jgi:hypothetical protein
MVRLRMHRDHHGCWADSEDIPNWTIAGHDALEVMQLVDEVEADPELIGLNELLDIRWQWCNDPSHGVRAIRFTNLAPWQASQDNAPGQRCPCSTHTKRWSYS